MQNNRAIDLMVPQDSFQCKLVLRVLVEMVQYLCVSRNGSIPAAGEFGILFVPFYIRLGARFLKYSQCAPLQAN